MGLVVDERESSTFNEIMVGLKYAGGEWQCVGYALHPCRVYVWFIDVDSHVCIDGSLPLFQGSKASLDVDLQKKGPSVGSVQKGKGEL